VINYWYNKSILVTGANGFIGSHVCRRLVASGANVVGLVRDQYRNKSIYKEVEGDITNPVIISEILDTYAPELVLHLASVGASDHFIETEKAIMVNTIGLARLLKAVDGNARVVVARSPLEINPNSPYAVSKAAGWDLSAIYSRTRGWSIVGAMIYQCYGVGQSSNNVIPAALSAFYQSEDFPLSPGNQIRDWIFVDDVVDGLMSLVESGFDIPVTIDLGTGVGTSLREVIDLLHSKTGHKGNPNYGELPYRPSDEMNIIADADRTYELINWRSRTNIEEGLSILMNSEVA
tara:strand:+ start:1084 stop:1956 length:873 start_codon:yes stop_codon:yes gene_type:complete